MDMNIRPRRLRNGANLRKMVRETRMDKSSLIYPMFVKKEPESKRRFLPCRVSTVTVSTSFPTHWRSL